MNLKHIVVGLFAVGLVFGASQRAYADICLQDDNTIFPTKYQLQIAPGNTSIGTPIVVTGLRNVALIHYHPVTGTLQPNPIGGVIMSLQTVLDFGSGTWTHPMITTIIRFGATTITYDQTAHGNGAPSVATGVMHVIACPVSNPAPPQ